MRAADALRFGKNTDSCIIHDSGEIHILVNASLRLLIARWPLMAPSCPTHLQNLAQLVEDHWRNPDRLGCLFLSGARTFSATLAHPERLSPRRATHGDGRVSINSTNNGCDPKAAAFCWHTHSKATVTLEAFAYTTFEHFKANFWTHSTQFRILWTSRPARLSSFSRWRRGATPSASCPRCRRVTVALPSFE